MTLVEGERGERNELGSCKLQVSMADPSVGKEYRKRISEKNIRDKYSFVKSDSGSVREGIVAKLIHKGCYPRGGCSSRVRRLLVND